MDLKEELIQHRVKLAKLIPTKWVVVDKWAEEARPFFEDHAPQLLEEFDRYSAIPDYRFPYLLPPYHMVDPWLYYTPPLDPPLEQPLSPIYVITVNRKQHAQLLRWVDAVLKDWGTPRLRRRGLFLVMGRRMNWHTIFLAFCVSIIFAITVWAVLQ